MTEPVSVSRDINAPAEKVWAMIADVTRMGEWSPEAVGSVWLKGASGPTAGSKFKGSNQNGKKKWDTIATVVDADPGKVFAFRVTAVGLKIAEWRYEFEPTASGCRVTETWIDERGWLASQLGKPASGVADRLTHNRAGMETTLERLATAAESASA